MNILNILDEYVELTSSSESDTEDDMELINDVIREETCEPGLSTNKRASKQFLTTKLVAALDKSKVSDGELIYFLQQPKH